VTINKGAYLYMNRLSVKIGSDSRTEPKGMVLASYNVGTPSNPRRVLGSAKRREERKREA
jgi:hypothetical protein